MTPTLTHGIDPTGGIWIHGTYYPPIAGGEGEGSGDGSGSGSGGESGSSGAGGTEGGGEGDPAGGTKEPGDEGQDDVTKLKSALQKERDATAEANRQLAQLRKNAGNEGELRTQLETATRERDEWRGKHDALRVETDFLAKADGAKAVRAAALYKLAAADGYLGKLGDDGKVGEHNWTKLRADYPEFFAPGAAGNGDVGASGGGSDDRNLSPGSRMARGYEANRQGS